MRTTFPKYTELELPLLQAVIDRGGSIWFSLAGDELEDELADYFDLSTELREYSSPTINAKGHRKWRNMIQYARRRLVDRGSLDNSSHDRWGVTEIGYSELGVKPRQVSV